MVFGWLVWTEFSHRAPRNIRGPTRPLAPASAADRMALSADTQVPLAHVSSPLTPTGEPAQVGPVIPAGPGRVDDTCKIGPVGPDRVVPRGLNDLAPYAR
ncbi:hypothetical protein DWB77_03757 [Streptomyces hundungensis]|uniref:Uncharacterized protein n=1 Tax=Streptomyces hundungensis TaxID=1077946 RepID=A0A387HMS0_9ACTN|nr:hypothetical protein DWB77_03757 [Streptomyces hundungensis]